MEKFTKIYKTERELLRKTGSVNAYEVYMHLKDSSSYYKEEFYDLTKCVAEYLDMPERSVKDAIKRLKEVGLIEVSKKGKVNVYKLPYAQEKVEKQDKKEQESVNGVKTELFKVAAVKVNANIENYSEEDIFEILDRNGITADVEPFTMTQGNIYKEISEQTKGEWTIGEIMKLQNDRFKTNKLRIA